MLVFTRPKGLFIVMSSTKVSRFVGIFHRVQQTNEFKLFSVMICYDIYKSHQYSILLISFAKGGENLVQSVFFGGGKIEKESKIQTSDLRLLQANVLHTRPLGYLKTNGSKIDIKQNHKLPPPFNKRISICRLDWYIFHRHDRCFEPE